jgi:hypothetical protein
MAPYALHRADGDMTKAITLLTKDVEAQPDLYRALMHKELCNKCDEAVGVVQSRRSMPQPRAEELERQLDLFGELRAEPASRSRPSRKAKTPDQSR